MGVSSSASTHRGISKLDNRGGSLGLGACSCFLEWRGLGSSARAVGDALTYIGSALGIQGRTSLQTRDKGLVIWGCILPIGRGEVLAMATELLRGLSPLVSS